MHNKILILGAGAIGSNLARLLLPDLKGQYELEILDLDTVEERNVQAGTQFYTPDQVGLPKVEALQYNLYKHYGQEVAIHHCRFPSGFAGDLGRYDFLVDCFDNSESRGSIQREWQGRRVFRDTAVKLLHIGFSDRFTFAIEWGENYKVPGDIQGLDICEHEGAATFVNFVASVGSWVLQNALKNAYFKEVIGNQERYIQI